MARDSVYADGMFFVYYLQGNSDGRFYVGYSSDLRRRVDEHNRGNNTSTRGQSWSLVYYEAYLTESAARKRERVLKGDGRTRRWLTARIRQMLDETSD